jgi:hypothetical protein
MTDAEELIVRFRRGVPEDDARTLAATVGATVRRRMRADHADEIMLLLRVPPGALAAAEARLQADARVAATERNVGGFGAL